MELGDDDLRWTAFDTAFMLLCLTFSPIGLGVAIVVASIAGLLSS